MKEIRIKLEDDVFNSIKDEATAIDSFPAVIVKTIVESHYKKDLGGIFVKFAPEQLQKIYASCKKCSLDINTYLRNMVDKFMSGDTTNNVVFNVPKNMTESQIVSWFHGRVITVARQLGNK